MEGHLRRPLFSFTVLLGVEVAVDFSLQVERVIAQFFSLEMTFSALSLSNLVALCASPLLCFHVSLLRGFRYYYKSQVLLPVFGRRLVYKFGPNATGWRP